MSKKLFIFILTLFFAACGSKHVTRENFESEKGWKVSELKTEEKAVSQDGWKVSRLDKSKPAPAVSITKSEDVWKVTKLESVEEEPAPLKKVIEKVHEEDIASIDFGDYYALVIGNNDYKYVTKLLTAINDAKEIGAVLESKYGFNVELLLDATRSDILMALNRYRQKLTMNDNLMLYYAGHGWLDKEADEGYWLPVDAEHDNAVNWVSNSSISSVVKAMEAKHVLIVADSCYSGKLVRGLKIRQKKPNHYERLSKKKARTALTSGGLEPVADSGKEGHSVFAAEFIDALNENTAIIDGTELFSNIRRPVMLNSDQTPEYSDIRKAGHDGGDFLFLRKK